MVYGFLELSLSFLWVPWRIGIGKKARSKRFCASCDFCVWRLCLEVRKGRQKARYRAFYISRTAQNNNIKIKGFYISRTAHY